MFKKALIVGASRGLGRSLSQFMGTHFESVQELHLVSRRQKGFHEVGPEAELKNGGTRIHFRALDMSKDKDQDELISIIEKNEFDLVIYCAGGGPHGEFASKEWKDHS